MLGDEGGARGVGGGQQRLGCGWEARVLGGGVAGAGEGRGRGGCSGGRGSEGSKCKENTSGAGGMRGEMA